MRFGVKLADKFQRLAAVHQIVDDENAGAVAHQLRLRRLDDMGIPLRLVAVGFDRNGVDHPHVELAGDDHGRRHAATRDCDDGAPAARLRLRSLAVEPPCQCARIAVQLVPADVKSLFMRQTVVHGGSQSGGGDLDTEGGKKGAEGAVDHGFQSGIAALHAVQREDAGDEGIPESFVQKNSNEHESQRNG